MRRGGRKRKEVVLRMRERVGSWRNVYHGAGIIKW